jgi:hypothetical protein
MRLRQIAAIIVVVLVGTGIVTGTASAATTYAVQWYSGGSTLNEEVAIKGKLNAKFELRTAVAGEPVTLTATGLDCVSCTITNAAVTFNTAKTAISKGVFKLTGVTVDQPTGCKVRNKTETGTVGVLETVSLENHFDWMSGSNFYAQFAPASGTRLATAYLEGGECESIEGPYGITGTLFGRAIGETGVEATEMAYEFSLASQGEVGPFKFGANEAEIGGVAAFQLESGKGFELR